MYAEEFDPYEPTDLDRVLELEADSFLLVHEDPEGRLHGAPRAAAIPTTWPCTALVQVGGRDEFGKIHAEECNAPASYIGGPDDSSWRCEAGHQHEDIRSAWAPFGSAWEAEQLERVA